MSGRRTEGRATGSILLLICILIGAGGWNYHRNLQIEKETEGARPYERYAVKDLEALRQAYSSELAGVQAQFESAQRKRVRPKRDAGSMTDNVEQFQATTQTSQAIRRAAASLSERQSEIAELDRELEIRTRFGVGLMRHVKRLTTI